MKDLVNKLQYIIPDINIKSGDSFCWSPATKTITFKATGVDAIVGKWSLLHEAGHAFLGHSDYSSDVDLLMMEVAAWTKATAIAAQLDLAIDKDHIEDCLDTYRDWLHQRSTCPRCGVVSLQDTQGQYQCHNCLAKWQVSASRFCRPYRISNSKHTKRPLSESKTPTTAFM